LNGAGRGEVKTANGLIGRTSRGRLNPTHLGNIIRQKRHIIFVCRKTEGNKIITAVLYRFYQVWIYRFSVKSKCL
jgi:hypothetical protein